MPNSYTEEQKVAFKNEIVDRISLGETLRSICREEGKPHWKTVYDWRKEDEDFQLRFAHARELGFDAIAEECFDIADNASNDWMEKNDKDNKGWQINGDHVQRDKMRIETRLKLLAKWSNKYSDKINLGGQKDNPLIIKNASELTDEQLAIIATGGCKGASGEESD